MTYRDWPFGLSLSFFFFSGLVRSFFFMSVGWWLRLFVVGWLVGWFVCLLNGGDRFRVSATNERRRNLVDFIGRAVGQ